MKKLIVKTILVVLLLVVLGSMVFGIGGLGTRSAPDIIVDGWRMELAKEYTCTVVTFRLLWFSPTITLVFIEELDLAHSEPPIPPAPPLPEKKKK